MGYSKQWVHDLLRRLDHHQAADDALRELPDEVELEELQEFAARHGIFRGELIDRMGGSP